MDGKVSIIIPARNEIYLAETVNDIFKKATGDIEVIVVLDGYWPHKMPEENPRLITVHRERQGMRASINSAVDISRGKYILKVDAHCMFAEGFDEVLSAECDKDWIVIPRRYSLDIDAWSIRQHRPFVDYEYLGWPYRQKNSVHGSKTGIHAWVWDERIAERSNKLLDENMTFQGSCWFTPKDYFLNGIGPMQSDGYGTFIGEAQEIGLKAWLGGGKVMTNKKTWYAHLWKGDPYRKAHLELLGIPYTRIGHSECVDGNNFSIDYWINNRWSERKHDLSWLVERFWPVPSWPEERDQWTHLIT